MKRHRIPLYDICHDYLSFLTGLLQVEVKAAPTFPDGGTKAWMAVLGCSLVSFTSYGTFVLLLQTHSYYTASTLCRSIERVRRLSNVLCRAPIGGPFCLRHQLDRKYPAQRNIFLRASPGSCDGPLRGYGIPISLVCLCVLQHI